MYAKYNSRDAKYKKPFGAVKNDEPVSLSVYVEDGTYINWIKLLIINAHEDFSQEVYFSYNCFDDNFHRFDCQFAIEKPDVYYYTFEFDTEYGKFHCENSGGELRIGEELQKWQLTVYDKNFLTPDWVKGGIMYQIFPDRFKKSEKFELLQAKGERLIHENWEDIPDFIYNNPNYQGNDYFLGNLDGIIEQLDYLKSLNVDIIYLNPVFESQENHRYSTGDYTKIDPYLGDNAIFKKLIKECEKKGIKIILDGVFSHTGIDSVYFNKYGHYDTVGAYNSKESPYYEWYKFYSHPDGYESWWGFRNLPCVNEEHPEFMEYILDKNSGILKMWQDMGVFGWRLDVCDELPDIFIDKLRDCIKSTNPDAFIVGEVWEDATTKESYGIKRKYLLGEQLDSVMNYPFRTAIIEFVKNGGAAVFIDEIMTILENYPKPIIDVLMNIIGTHDTTRIITEFGVEHTVEGCNQGSYRMNDYEYQLGKSRMKMAAFLQFVLPGIPCVYYGDEAGLQGFSDPYCRMGYPYGKEDKEILEFYIFLSGFRKQYKEEFLKDLVLMAVDNGFFAFSRGNLVFAVNNSDYEYKYYTDTEKELLNYNDISYGNSEISLPPKSFGVFEI